MAVGLQVKINVTGAISAGLSWPFAREDRIDEVWGLSVIDEV